MKLRSVSRRQWLITLVIAALCVCAAVYVGVIIRHEQTRRADTLAENRERRVRELLRDEPLASILLRPHISGLHGLLASLGFPGPARRSGADALARINPLVPKKGLSKTLGPTIDACRNDPVVRSAVLLLSRKVPVTDLETTLGPYAARLIGDAGGIKEVEFYQYGNLDVGIKDGAIVAVRVRESN